MSEDYKKIALEDVKVGQRVHLNFYRDALVFASYTGTVVSTNTELKIIALGSDREHFQVYLPAVGMPDIFIVEDAPTDTEMFGLDMFTDGVTYFEDTGTLRFAGVEHWERHEPRLRGKRLKDADGDVWAYIDGKWKYRESGCWHADLSIKKYVEEGFTIVDSLD